MLSANFEIFERDGIRHRFKRSMKKKNDRRENLCRVRVRRVWEIPCSAAPLAETRDAVCLFVGKEKEKRTEFSSSAGLWFCLSDTEREVMAHFVKLIGSLERYGSELVPLNFSSDYTKELTG